MTADLFHLLAPGQRPLDETPVANLSVIVLFISVFYINKSELNTMLLIVIDNVVPGKK